MPGPCSVHCNKPGLLNRPEKLEDMIRSKLTSTRLSWPGVPAHSWPVFYLLLACFLPICGMAQNWAELRWEKHFGGKGPDEARMAIQAMDGSVVAVGLSSSKFRRGSDMLLVKIRPEEDIVIPDNHGGPGDDGANAVVETRDGGFVVAGFTESPWPGSLGGRDAWLVKFDEHGIPLWDAILGGSQDDEFLGLAQTKQGELLAAGHKGGKAYLVKLDYQGKLLWELELEQEKSIAFGLALDTEGHALLTGQMDGRALLALADKQGHWRWSRPASDASFTEGRDIIHSRDGGWAVAGIGAYSRSREEIVLLKLNSEGKEEWIQHFGGYDNDGGQALAQAPDGKYILTGYSKSHRRGARRNKLFLLDILESGERAGEEAVFFGGDEEDEGYSLAFSRTGRLLVAGKSASFEKNQPDAWVLEIDYPFRQTASAAARFQLSEPVLADANGSAILEANERAYLAFSLDNQSNVSSGMLKVVARNVGDPETPWLSFMDTVLLGSLAAREQRQVSVPLRLDRAALVGEQLTRVEVFDSRGQVAAGFDYPIKLQAEQAPLLEIVSSRFLKSGDELPKRGAPIELEVLIRNKGTAVAEDVQARFLLPFKVRELAGRDHRLGDLPPGASARVVFSFEARSFYEPDSIAIKCLAWERTLQHVAQDIFQIRISSFYDLEDEPEVIHRVKPIYRPFQDRGGGPSAPGLIVHPPDENPVELRWRVPDPFEDGLEFDHPLSYINFKVDVRAPGGLTYEHFSILRNGKRFELDSTKLHADQLLTKREEEYAYSAAGQGELFWYRYTGEVHFEKGLNKVQVEVEYEGKKYTSKVLAIHYVPPRGNLHLYAFGIPQDGLFFTGKDARDFAAAFSSQQEKLYNEVFINTYTDKEATTVAALQKAIEKIRNAYFINNELGEYDSFVFFFSSHGFEEPARRGTEFRLAASDFNYLYRRSTSLDYEEDIIENLYNVPVKKFVFIDACYSGAIANIESGGAKGDSPPQEAALSKAIVELALASPEFYTLLSCSPGELSYEDKAWNNGAFTKALLEAFWNQLAEGLSGPIRADTNGDQVLTMAELYHFVQQRVPAILRTKQPKPSTSQVPYMPESQREQVLPLLVVSDNQEKQVDGVGK